MSARNEIKLFLSKHGARQLWTIERNGVGRLTAFACHGAVVVVHDHERDGGGFDVLVQVTHRLEIEATMDALRKHLGLPFTEPRHGK